MVIPANVSAVSGVVTDTAPRFGRVSALSGGPALPEAAPPAAESSAPAWNVFRAAERSVEFFDHLRTHYRESRRQNVEIPARIRLLLEGGEVYDTGTATVSNLSPSGALLLGLSLAKSAYPIRPFKVEMVLEGGEYEGIGIEARPIRFEPKTGGLGVKFEEIFVSV